MNLKLVQGRKIKENQHQSGSQNLVADEFDIFELLSNGDHRERYVNILDSLSKNFEGHLVTLSRHDFSSGQGEVLYQHPSSSSFSKDYQKNATHNPWFLSAKEYIEANVMLSQNLLSSNELVKTDFYQNLLEPHGIFYALHSVLLRCENRVYLASIYRSQVLGCFTEEDKTKIKPFVRLFSRELLKDLNYTQASHLNMALKMVLDQEKHLVLLMNQDGRVIYCNREANFLSSKEINIENGMLLKNSTMISTAIFNAVNSNLEKRAADQMQTVELVLPIPRSNKYLTLSLFPVGKIYSEQSGGDEEVVCITAKNEHHDLSQHICKIVMQFNISPAEQKVLSKIINGQSISAASQSLHISKNTISSHLKNIFHKTDTHSQTELLHFHSVHCDCIS